MSPLQKNVSIQLFRFISSVLFNIHSRRCDITGGLSATQLGSSEESVSLGLGQTGTTLAQLDPSVRDCQLFLKNFCLVMIVLKGL